MITYVTSRWGEPTQTFVRREAAAVAASGIPVRALSLKKPASCLGEIEPVWFGPLTIARGLLRAVARHPIRSAQIVAEVRLASWRNSPSMLMAVIVGLSWSGAGRTGGHLHSHFGWVSGAAAMAAARHSGLNFSIVFHAFELHTASKRDGFATRVAQLASQTYVISENDIGVVERYFGVMPCVLRMGVPAARTAARRSPEVDAIDSERPLRVISVGSLTEKKGHDYLIRSIACTSGPCSLTVVGDGPDRPALEDLVAELGIERDVTFTGLLGEEAIWSLLDGSDVFALACIETPSGDRDGIPVAIMEAMAAGLPVITTNAGAIDELVAGVGLQVAQRDSDALAAAFDQCRDPERRQALGEAGRQRIIEHWTVERSAEFVGALL